MMTRRIQLALLTIMVAVACGLVRTGVVLGAHTRILVGPTGRNNLVRFARQYLGVRYVYGGMSPRTGFDCSGFTRFVYAHFGITLPHFAAGQFALGRSVSRAALRPGDLVFFDGLGHVGLYLGSGMFIHAPHTGARVEISSLNGWYATRFDGARRLVV
jgi:cell wall-associated NlpC family hydrolase